jgi:hypothetical protein
LYINSPFGAHPRLQIESKPLQLRVSKVKLKMATRKGHL